MQCEGIFTAPGAVEGDCGSMLLPAALEHTLQGLHRLQESDNDSDVVPGSPCEGLCSQPASEEAGT